MLVEIIEPDPSNLVVSGVNLLDMFGMPGERQFVYSVQMEVEAAVTVELNSINLNIIASAHPPPKRRNRPNFSPLKFSTETKFAERAIQQATVTQQQNYLAQTKTEISSDISNSSVSESKLVNDASNPTASSAPKATLDPFGSQTPPFEKSHGLPSRGITPSVEGTTPPQFRMESNLTATTKTVMKGDDPVGGTRFQVSADPGDLVAKSQSLASEKTRKAGLGAKQIADQISQAMQPIKAIDSRNAQLSLFRSGIDPAAIGGSIKPDALPEHIQEQKQQGINTQPRAFPSVSPKHFKLNPRLSDIICTPAPEPEPPEPVVIETSIFRISRRLVIREEAIAGISKFYVIASLETPNGFETAKNTIEVNHLKNVNKLLTPYQAPSLSASFLRQGQISVKVQQIDLQGTRVRLQRRKAPSQQCKGDNGSSWETVFEENLDINDGQIRFIDPVSVGGHSIMYRAVAIGTNGKQSEAFSSAVVHPRRNMNDLVAALQQGRLMNSVAELDPLATVATIKPTDLPEDAIAVSIRKYDLRSRDNFDRLRGKSRGFTYVGDTPIEMSKKVAPDSPLALNFQDRSLKPGGRYAYVPVAYTKKGKMIIGGETIIDIPQDAGDATKVLTIVDNLKTKTKDSAGLTLADPSVNFKIQGSMTDFGFESIQSAIGQSATAGLFGGDIASKRSKFNDLIQYEVVRTNQTSGETESFGVMPPGEFSDNAKTRKIRNVKPLEHGTSYVYTVTTCVRSPESLFAGLASQDIDLETLQRFSKAVAKFRGPSSLRSSTLPSTARAKSPELASNIEDPNAFLAGRTRESRNVTVTLPKIVPTISSVRLTQKKLHNILEWDAGTLAEAAMFDHFRVYICRHGARRLLASVHADSTSKDFTYTHFMQEPLSRPVRYEVVPVDLNFKDFPAVATKRTNPSNGGVISQKVAANSKVTKKYGQQQKPDVNSKQPNPKQRSPKSVEQERQDQKRAKARPSYRNKR